MTVYKISNKKIIYGILNLLWMGVIFYMSSRTAEESVRASSGITGLVADIAVGTGLVEREEITADVLSVIHKWIRIFAHFFEYMVLGILSFGFLKQFQYKKLIKVALYSLIFCIAYAISDEIHQYFVPGRAMDILDVLTDTAGSFTGIAIVFFIEKTKMKS